MRSIQQLFAAPLTPHLRVSTGLFLLTALTSACAVQADADWQDEETSSQDQAAIVSGKINMSLPSVGLLLDVTKKDRVGVCTGTLVGRRTVLTGAHCFDTPNGKSVFIVHDAKGKGTVANVVKFAQAPGYRKLPGSGVTLEQFFANPDIAVARLDRDLPARPIPIAADAPKFGTFVTLSGYGATAAGATDAGRAKRSTRNLITLIENDHIGFSGAGPVFGLSCGGDSGGPALVNNARGGPAVAAVTHFGDCKRQSAYTRADVFRGWIQKVAQGDVLFAANTGR